jgi:hypothetical protein
MPPDLRFVLRVTQKTRRVWTKLAGQEEAGGNPPSEQDSQGITEVSRSLHLEDQVIALLLDLLQESWEAVDLRLPLWETGDPWKLYESVEIMAETLDKTPRPGQSDVSNLSLRKGCPECSQSRDCAKQVPELERA